MGNVAIQFNLPNSTILLPKISIFMGLAMILRSTVVEIEKPSCVISCDSSKTIRKSCDEIAHNTNTANRPTLVLVE